MEKRFLTIDEQVRLLESRGMRCGEETELTLLREGYYAVVNGYKRPFVDPVASAASGEDRYFAGTSFSDVYALFRFDRSLRALTFRHLMMVEATLRSLISYAFCSHHPKPEAYLDGNNFTQRRDYIRGEGEYDGDLRWMIDTLEHHARSRERDPRGPGRDVRVAHFQDVHDTVPLWVLVDELTFGNLKYLFALLKREEQLDVCDGLARISQARPGAALAPRELGRDLEAIVDVRNLCAHGERLYDARVGVGSSVDFVGFVGMVAAFLDPSDLAHLVGGIETLVADYSAKSATIARELERTHLAGV